MDRLTRRKFLSISADMGAVLLAVVAATAGLARMPLPKVLPDPTRRFRVGRAEDFPPGSERYFSRERVLVRADEQGIYAVSMICTHLGCTVTTMRAGGFICPCHGSRYRENGAVLSGPAPRRLRNLRVLREASGWIVVDAGREVQSDQRLEA